VAAGATFWFSFTDADPVRSGRRAFVGLDNFALLLADPEWWRSVWNTLVFTAVSVALEVCLGFAIALALHAQFPGRGPLRAAVLIPWAIPTVVSAKMWGWMFHDVYGVVNAMLLDIGILSAPLAWTASPTWPWPHSSRSTSGRRRLRGLLLLAALQMLPKDYYDAAQVDGASTWTQFFAITVPLMKPALAWPRSSAPSMPCAYSIWSMCSPGVTARP